MLRYVTVSKCKRRKVNEADGSDAMSMIGDKVCQRNNKSGSSLSLGDRGNSEFRSQRGNTKDNGIAVSDASSVTGARRQMFELKEVKGDLFSCPSTTSLAHCISADCHMGKGIAVIFKKKFGGVKELLSQGQSPGGVATLQRDGRFVYYLVTKEKYWHKPTYETLTASLEAMKKHCQKHDTKQLAMPLIGCGLDGLKWPKVCAIIKDVFDDANVTITVYSL